MAVRTLVPLSRKPAFSAPLAFIFALMFALGGTPSFAQIYTSGTWHVTNDANEPAQLSGHTVVWTGTQAIIWGGRLGGWNSRLSTNTGWIYNSVDKSFRAISTVGAPSRRYHHTAVWTGSRMIVWGGRATDDPGGCYGDGGIYDPATDSWTQILYSTMTGRLAEHVAVWTGSKMIVWGGNAYNQSTKFGASYDPVNDRWSNISTCPLSARSQMGVVWTGSRMIVWGGSALTAGSHPAPVYYNDGASYSPASNQWTMLPAAPIVGRDVINMVWTGSRVLILGGGSADSKYADGASYDPAKNVWTKIDLSGAAGRSRACANWTGTDLLTWGGGGNSAMYNDGLDLDTTLTVIKRLPETGAPSPRVEQQSVWDGANNEMVIFGGLETDYNMPRTWATYSPIPVTVGSVKVTIRPAAAAANGAQWQRRGWSNWFNSGEVEHSVPPGDQAIVFSGITGWTTPTKIPVTVRPGEMVQTTGTYTSTLAYTSGTWHVTNDANATTQLSGHTVVWTGTQALIWGGRLGGWNGRTPTNTGWVYNAADKSFRVISTVGAPSARYNHTAVWTGSRMIVWGGRSSSDPYGGLNNGASYDPASDTWTPLSVNGAPPARAEHVAVWTGSRMIVWGGNSAWSTNTGGIYDPASDTWSAMASGPLAARSQMGAVWTGSRMIVWGGSGLLSFYTPGVYYNDGASYDPASNQWTLLGSSPLGGRDAFSMVWNGSQILIMGGGSSNGVRYSDGASFDPVTGVWQTLNLNSAAGRSRACASWTGSDMFYWGGGTETQMLDDGLDLDLDTGMPTITMRLPESGAPSPRVEHQAVWDSVNNEMLVYGGVETDYNQPRTWATFKPTTGTQGSLQVTLQPTAAAGAWRRLGQSSWLSSGATEKRVPVGSQTIEFKPINGWTTPANAVVTILPDQVVKTSATYVSTLAYASGTWRVLSDTNVTSQLSGHTVVWTGKQAIVWGGRRGGWNARTPTNTGWIYNAADKSFRPISTVGAPSARYNHTAVWTGKRMIVWGGRTSDDSLVSIYNGGSYDPVSDTWTALATARAPYACAEHVAVWTGSRMIIWGGNTNYGATNYGGIYDPVSDSWSTTMASCPLSARSMMGVVWTGSSMIVWGGSAGAGSYPSLYGIYFKDGASYDPVSNKWTMLPAAPISGRDAVNMVWTCSKVLILGGGGSSSGGTKFGDGASYDPVSGAWGALDLSSMAERSRACASWSGSDTFYWGGGGYRTIFNDGLEVNTSSSEIRRMPETNAPQPRVEPQSVWDDANKEMVIFGGVETDYNLPCSVAIYKPAEPAAVGSLKVALTPASAAAAGAQWRRVGGLIWHDSGETEINIPAGSQTVEFKSVNGWTTPANAPVTILQNQLAQSSGVYVSTVAYGAGVWTVKNDPNATAQISGHTIVWAGQRALIWGGRLGGWNARTPTNTGWIYNAADKSFHPITTVGAPSARYNHTAIWTGNRMIVWGGRNSSDPSGCLDSGASYDPVSNTWTALSMSGMPTARAEHVAVWTGSKMIVWGGNNTWSSNSGGIYDPVSNTWSAMGYCPLSGRSQMGAVWTGTRMLVWGGSSIYSPCPVYYNNGGVYDPVRDAWQTFNNAPIGGRDAFSMVWTGFKVVILGGGANGGARLADGATFDPANGGLADARPVLCCGPQPRQRQLVGIQFVLLGGRRRDADVQ